MTELSLTKSLASDTLEVCPRILLITSCTGEKRFKPANQLTLEDFKDSARLEFRSTELAEFSCAAHQMYTGLQHLRVLEGVNLLRQSYGHKAVDVMIISAGYGLIPEDKFIVPYSVTFNAMKGYEVDDWAKVLSLHEEFEKAISGYELIFILLGDKYLRSLQLPIKISSEQSFIFLASKLSAKYIRCNSSKTYILTLSNAEAKRYCYGLVGLKGFLFKKFAQKAAHSLELVHQVYQEPGVFERIIQDESQHLDLSFNLPQLNFQSKQLKTPSANLSNLPNFIPIPPLPPAANLHLGMQYFIPEWDDRVDPGFDFLKDLLTPGRDPYEDEVYAHEIFPTPNYDGILVSRVVIDKSKKKKNLIYEVGVHKLIRFTGPVMGDCGAFGYIKEDIPPYSIEEILEYYHQLGFNYGVSIDHLIVGPFSIPGVREKRYELTLKNAFDFLKQHQDRGYQFTPIGVAQGWDLESYSEAVKELISMGYDYIALGGLTRTPSKNILEILQAVYLHLTPNTRMHLFGVGRINAIPAFRHFGVTSFDSAGPLRSAWLDSAFNYHTPTGATYAAARIPQVNGTGLRIKRLLEAGISNKETLYELEQNALYALRAFDAGKFSLEETLNGLLAYDELLELPRDGKVAPSEQARRQTKHIAMYKKLLEDRPWKYCNCKICKEIGVEVVIFRGNDRNRRRGFHNTYVFYERFKEILIK